MGTLFEKGKVIDIQNMEVTCGLSLAAGVRQDKQEFAGGLLMKSGTHGKATRPVDRRLTSADADIGPRGDGHREQIYCSGSRTGKHPRVQ